MSRGAFLTGSFGSGKSHFMAVLHALLEQEPAARAIAELQQVIGKHDHALRERRILPLAFHLLGAETLEAALFDGYLRQIRELPPGGAAAGGAPVRRAARRRGPDARAAGRRRVLRAGSTAGAGGRARIAWSGVLGSGAWDAATYDAGPGAAPASEERLRLVSALVETYFTAYTQQAEYVDLDTGLAAIAAHAKGLGYDAVVLFLDELVLWLAFSVQDREFFRRESQKLTKLVESATGSRAIPLVSFVARQMDLRRWFADAGASGAEQEALDRAFRHQEGRFPSIVAGRRQPAVRRQQRLLRPKDAHAAEVLDEAFRGIDRRPEVWDVLLDGVNTDERHRGADEKAFRLTYPFSPALVSTLRSLASVMQRERTALKVMQQMLVDRRDTLTVEQIIPVGDAFDYIVSGTTRPWTPRPPRCSARRTSCTPTSCAAARARCTGWTARTVREHPEALPTAYRTDDRLAKTLLLSAVAPNVPALKSLTAARLASLNHGSIVSPLPGQEANVVLAKVRTWARDVPEIHLDGDRREPDDPGPAGRRRLRVDRRAGQGRGQRGPPPRAAQGPGQREPRRGAGTAGHPGRLPPRGDLARVAPRGRRAVRQRPRPRLAVRRPLPGQPGHVAVRHRLPVRRSRATRPPRTWPGSTSWSRGGVSTRTIVWLPRFLSQERLRDLRRLVILDWLLEGSGDRWASHADHLTEGDRALAKNILESNRNTLRAQPARTPSSRRTARRACAPARSSTTRRTTGPSCRLEGTFNPASPVGATLAAAFRNLVSQAFDATYPGHPHFEPDDVEVKARPAADRRRTRRRGPWRTRRCASSCRATTRRSAGSPARSGVGTASEMHFLLGDDRFTPWSQEIEKALGRRAQDGVAPDAPVSVRELRDWIDAVTPAQGLRPEVSDLVVIAWAGLRQRAWFHHGAALPSAPEPGSLMPAMELRTQPMPDHERVVRGRRRRGRVVRDPGVAAPDRAGRGRPRRNGDRQGHRAGSCGRGAGPGDRDGIPANGAGPRRGQRTGSTPHGRPRRWSSGCASCTGSRSCRRWPGARLGDGATAAGRSLASAAGGHDGVDHVPVGAARPAHRRHDRRRAGCHRGCRRRQPGARGAGRRRDRDARSARPCGMPTATPSRGSPASDHSAGLRPPAADARRVPSRPPARADTAYGGPARTTRRCWPACGASSPTTRASTSTSPGRCANDRGRHRSHLRPSR